MIIIQKNKLYQINENKSGKLAIFIIAFVLVFAISFPLHAFGEETTHIPSWMKINAVWWGEEKISDSEFVESLQFLIDNQIILVPESEQEFESICGPGAELDEKTDECIIPAEFESSEVFSDSLSAHQEIITSWIKVTALWWGQGKISDQDFQEAIQYLAENNVINLPQPELEEIIPEKKEDFETLYADVPTYTSSWTPIDRIGDFQIRGHNISENYQLRFSLINTEQEEISSDGTISISIFDESNRILYLDVFSIRKNDFSQYIEAFSNDENLAYIWEIPTSDVKKGFGKLGNVKIVFTDRGGNNYSNDFNSVSIPHFS